MEQTEYLNQYESRLMQNLLQLLTSSGKLDGQLLETPDITEKWEAMAPHYVADAIKEIAKYPLVSLGWAMYLGMGVAKYWDEDWETYGKTPNLYLHIRDIRGFDYMDEVVRGELLGLRDTMISVPSPKGPRNVNHYQECEELTRSCAQMALDMIRHEQIEPQSPLAFHVYGRSIKVLYKVGAAVALKMLGYKLTAM